MTKYLDENSLSFEIKVDFQPLSTDTYNESAIRESILQAGERNCFIVAAQFACIGMGNKSTGHYMESDGSIRLLSDLMDSCGIVYTSPQNAKLEPGALTPKRLARFFRYVIRNKIKSKELPPSFLWYKYNTTASPEICFPGAEYMVSGKDAEDLIKAYANLDLDRGTNFASRIGRILQVRASKKSFHGAI
jgi:hypothetical protein